MHCLYNRDEGARCTVHTLRTERTHVKESKCVGKPAIMTYGNVFLAGTVDVGENAHSQAGAVEYNFQI